jgi:hypothetical protein
MRACASAQPLAICLGGILLAQRAQRALGSVSGAWSSLGRAAIAWPQVAELHHAGAGADATSACLAEAAPAAALVEAQGLRHAHAGTAAVLQGVDAPMLGERWHSLATAAPPFHKTPVLPRCWRAPSPSTR